MMCIGLRELKRLMLSILCLGFLSFVCLPGPGHAATSAGSTAYFTDFSFSVLDATTGGDITSLLTWVDDGPNSASLVELNLGSSNVSTGNVDETQWGPTSFSAQLPSVGFAQVTGNAYTFGANRLFAQSNVVLFDGEIGDALAQAVLSGQFTSPQGGFLTVTANYHLEGFVDSLPGGVAYADALVDLSLSDFDTGDFLAGGQDWPFINFPPNDFFSWDGTLQIVNFLLDPAITYDFEGSASTLVSAVGVPEPISLILLGSGMFGLAIVSRKFS